jgi:ABC-2 type transport system ATP-binding protein
MTPVEVVHAARWYGQVIAVNDVSLSVGPGVTGLLGPNGAGKTTLLRMMVGQLRPSRGEVKVLGRDVWRDRGVLRQVGYCPEHEGLYEELTAVEFCTALGELHGMPRAEAERRGQELLARVDLADAMHRRLGEYSKGMRQRAKLAQALMHDPEVIFLDEPLTGCDPMARVRVLEVIKEVAARGRCVVVSSHVLHEIEALTSNILLIHKGQLVAEGDVYAIRELIDRHPHKVRVVCDRPRELARALVGADHVLGISFVDDALVIETAQPDRCYPAIPEAARAVGAVIESLTSPDNNLAAVFRYLTEERHAVPSERA